MQITRRSFLKAGGITLAAISLPWKIRLPETDEERFLKQCREPYSAVVNQQFLFSGPITIQDTHHLLVYGCYLEFKKGSIPYGKTPITFKNIHTVTFSHNVIRVR